MLYCGIHLGFVFDGTSPSVKVALARLETATALVALKQQTLQADG